MAFPKIRRLGWAGVEIEYEGETLLIDYIQDTSPLPQLRSPEEPFPAAMGNAAGALVTHLHADHADAAALSAALKKGAPVLRPEPATGTEADLALTAHAEAQFGKYELATEIIAPWEERNIGPFKVYATPAIDGFGDPQIGYVVVCGKQKIFHTGDTIFHGCWWRIVNRYGPVNVAFLPINGPVVDFPLLQPASPLEAVLTPEQAAVAASILQAKVIVPVHYGSLHKPPMYIETPEPAKRLLDKVENALIKEPGEWFSIL